MEKFAKVADQLDEQRAELEAKAKTFKTAKSTKIKTARAAYDDTATIKVVGEHTRREGSRYHGGFEAMRKCKTVGVFRKVREKQGDAQERLRAALRDKFIQIGSAS